MTGRKKNYKKYIILRLLVKMEAWVNMLHLLAQPQKELQLDFKTNKNRQKIELDGSLTSKNLKKPYSSRQIGGAEMQR